MEKQRHYYKSFSNSLWGRENYQFEVGGEYTLDHDDTWKWFHYAQYASSTLIHHGENERVRICLVEALGGSEKFKAQNDGYNKGYYFTTNKIKILRELSYDEIISILEEEKCPFYMIVKYMEPKFEYLLANKAKIRKNVTLLHNVATRRDLTLEEKKAILPKSHSCLLEKSFS